MSRTVIRYNSTGCFPPRRRAVGGCGRRRGLGSFHLQQARAQPIARSVQFSVLPVDRSNVHGLKMSKSVFQPIGEALGRHRLWPGGPSAAPRALELNRCSSTRLTQCRSEAADQHCGGALQEARQAVRGRVLQEQSAELAQWDVSGQWRWGRAAGAAGGRACGGELPCPHSL